MTLIQTNWTRASDPSIRGPENVVGRIVEVEHAGKIRPVLQHRIENANPPSRDVSENWADPEKTSSKNLRILKVRFAAAFAEYEAAKKKQAEDEAAAEAAIQARIDAEVAKKLEGKAEADVSAPAKVEAPKKVVAKK